MAFLPITYGSNIFIIIIILKDRILLFCWKIAAIWGKKREGILIKIGGLDWQKNGNEYFACNFFNYTN